VLGGVSVPTPLWYRQQGHIATALGTQRKEEAELIRSRNDLARAINQHAREAETAQDQILVYEEGLLKQAQEALRIAQLSFRQGASSLLDVLDAQRVQRQITVDYNLARFELSLALTRFERALAVHSKTSKRTDERHGHFFWPISKSMRASCAPTKLSERDW